MTKPQDEDRVQVNVRISERLADQLDAKRVELQKKLGKIPTRSQVVTGWPWKTFWDRSKQGR